MEEPARTQAPAANGEEPKRDDRARSPARPDDRGSRDDDGGKSKERDSREHHGRDRSPSGDRHHARYRSRSRDRYDRRDDYHTGSRDRRYDDRGGSGGGGYDNRSGYGRGSGSGSYGGRGYDRDGGRGYDRDGGSRYRGDDRDRKYDNRSRYRSRSPSDAAGRGKSGISKEEHELLELKRDACTVFVGQLVVRAGDEEVRSYFEQVGPVNNISLIKDKVTGRSKGFGYVEFADLESVPKSLLLNGQKFCMKHRACSCSGFPILVKPSEAEKNYAAMAEAAGGSATSINAERRVYLGDVPLSITEGDLRHLGETIGIVEKVTIIRDDRGNPKGSALIVFNSMESAQRACIALHKLELADKVLKVGKMNAMGQVVAHDGEVFALDGGSGKALSAQARAALALQLAGATTQAAQQLGTSLMAAGGAGAATGLAATLALNQPVSTGGSFMQPASQKSVPSPCVLLKNLFDPTVETEKGWDVRVRTEVEAECRKSGNIVHFQLVRDSPGHVYIMYEDVGGAVACATALAGRLFGGRTVAVEFVTVPDYVSRYPEVASKV